MTDQPLPPAFPPELPRTQTSGLAIGGMVCGILSFCLGVCTAIPAIVLSVIALTKINKSAGRLQGQGMAIAGLVTGGLGMIVGTAILAGMLLPVLGVTRERALRANCQSQARQIMLAMKAYADDDARQRFPANFAVLVEKEFIVHTGILICPSSGRQPTIQGADDVDEKADYVIGAPGLQDDGSSDLIVLYCKGHPQRRPMGRNVYFADGHGEWMLETDFQRKLAAQREAPEDNPDRWR